MHSLSTSPSRWNYHSNNLEKISDLHKQVWGGGGMEETGCEEVDHMLFTDLLHACRLSRDIAP